MPGETAAGNLTLPKLTKRERSDFYTLMVCGYLLATAKETFAVAPGLAEVGADGNPTRTCRPVRTLCD